MILSLFSGHAELQAAESAKTTKAQLVHWIRQQKQHYREHSADTAETLRRKLALQPLAASKPTIEALRQQLQDQRLKASLLDRLQYRVERAFQTQTPQAFLIEHIDRLALDEALQSDQAPRYWSYLKGLANALKTGPETGEDPLQFLADYLQRYRIQAAPRPSTDPFARDYIGKPGSEAARLISAAQAADHVQQKLLELQSLAPARAEAGARSADILPAKNRIRSRSQ